MKKASLFLITLILAMAFTACGEITHETKNPELKPAETKATETKAPETDVPETDAPETKAPETKAPETDAPETKAPETKAPETKAPETEAPENADGTETITQTVLVDEAGVKITAKSIDKSGWLGPELKILIENNTEQNLTVQVKSCSVNGYMMDSSLSANVSSGKKVNDEIVFYGSALNAAGISTLADVELSFHIYNSDNWETYMDSASVTLKTSAADTYNYTYDDSGVLIYEKNNIKVVAKELAIDETWGADLGIYVYNGSNQPITVQTRDDSVNGFMVGTYGSVEVNPGKHCIDEITFSSSDLEANDITDITEYEFSLHIYNSDTWDTIDDSEPIALTFESASSTETNATETEAPATDAPENADGTETITQTVLVDEAGVKITAKSIDKSGWLGPEIKLLIENNTDKNLTVQARNCSVNGYMLDPSLSANITPGKKINDSITFMNSELEATGIEVFADIELSFHIYDSDTWDTYLDSSLITLKTSAAETYHYTFDDSGVTIYEKNNIKIVAKELTNDEIFSPDLKLYIYNGSNQPITVQTRDDSVNGFMVGTYGSFEVNSMKHCIGEISFSSSDLEENEITEITEYEFSLHIYNSDSWDTIDDSDPIVLTFN